MKNCFFSGKYENLFLFGKFAFLRQELGSLLILGASFDTANILGCAE